MVLKNALFLQNRVLKNAPFEIFWVLKNALFEFFLQKTIDIYKEI
jgi:hypothetical protein